MQLEQCATSLVLTSVLTTPTALFDHGNFRTRRQFPHGRWKIEMLIIHDKTENAPPCSAAETVKRLALRAHRERWGLFLMKGAERLKVGSGALERKIRSDHFNDVIRRRDLFDVL